jgi:hypothetical protein
MLHRSDAAWNGVWAESYKNDSYDFDKLWIMSYLVIM